MNQTNQATIQKNICFAFLHVRVLSSHCLTKLYHALVNLNKRNQWIQIALVWFNTVKTNFVDILCILHISLFEDDITTATIIIITIQIVILYRKHLCLPRRRHDSKHIHVANHLTLRVVNRRQYHLRLWEHWHLFFFVITF